MRQHAGFFILTAILMAGCAGVPFKPVKFSRVDALEPKSMLDNFKKRLPERFEIIESVVFKYRRREISALGYTRVDEKEKTFATAGLTPMGVKVFQLETTGDKVKASFTLPPEAEKKINREKMAQAMAEDFHRVYFDRIPGVNAAVTKTKDRIYFREPSGDGILESVFGGPDKALVQKRFLKEGREIWKVRYFEYRSKNSKIYPGGIFYENRRGKYKITLRLKEITA